MRPPVGAVQPRATIKLLAVPAETTFPLAMTSRLHLWAGGLVLALLTGCQHYRPAPLDAAGAAASLQERTLADPGLKTFLETNLHQQFTTWPPPEWNLPTLTLVAFYYHPSLEVARAQWRVAEAGVRTAGGRPNPVLSVTPGYSANAPAGVSPWFPSISVDIPLETAGKRGYRIATAQHLSEAARLNITSIAWQVRSQLHTGLVEHRAFQRRVALLQGQLAIQDSLVGLLEERLAVGAIAGPEAVPAHMARLKVAGELADAQRQAAISQAQLADALGLPVKAVDALRVADDPPLALADVTRLLTQAARDWALTNRADIRAGLADYAASQSALQLEIAKQYPDVHLSPGYQFDQGEHKWSLGLSVELPVLNRNQGPIGEALARREEAAARFLALQAKVLAEIDHAGEAYTAVSVQIASSAALYQAAREYAQSLRVSLDVGGTDRLEVDSARLEAAVAELALVEARRRGQLAVGQLETALQIPFDSLASIEQGHNRPPANPSPP